MTGDAMEYETIGCLMWPTAPVAPDTACAIVLDRLQNHPEEHMIAVVARGRPVGLVDRSQFLGEISKSYRYELFGRGESTYVRGKEGTGLGLSVTKTLVERHDGVLGIDRVVGRGTTVTVDFPAARSLLPHAARATA